MRVTRRQLRRIIREAVGQQDYNAMVTHDWWTDRGYRSDAELVRDLYREFPYLKGNSRVDVVVRSATGREPHQLDIHGSSMLVNRFIDDVYDPSGPKGEYGPGGEYTHMWIDSGS